MQWELTMVAPTPQQVMCREQLTSGTNLLQYTTRTVLGWFDDTAESVYGTVSGWTTTNVTAIVGAQFSGGLLQYQTQTYAAIGTVGAASAWSTLFSTVNVVAAVELQYDGGYGSAHAFQWQTAAFTAINSDYAGEGDVTESGWSNWASTFVQNDVTAVAPLGHGRADLHADPELHPASRHAVAGQRRRQPDHHHGHDRGGRGLRRRRAVISDANADDSRRRRSRRSDQSVHHRQRDGRHQSEQQRHPGADPADDDLHGRQPGQRLGQLGLVHAQLSKRGDQRGLGRHEPEADGHPAVRVRSRHEHDQHDHHAPGLQLMANLLALGGQLIQKAGSLVATSSSPSTCGCCGETCLACTLSGRIGTITISGLTSVTGGVPAGVNDPCGECAGLNASYGGSFNSATAPAPNTFLCGCNGPDNATFCNPYTPRLSPSLWALYNGSGSTLNYINPCGTGTIAVPAGYTYLYALLTAAVSEFGTVCNGCACFSVLQAGKISCPFSGLSLPLTSSAGLGSGCFCDLSAATVTAGIA